MIRQQDRLKYTLFRKQDDESYVYLGERQRWSEIEELFIENGSGEDLFLFLNVCFELNRSIAEVKEMKHED